MTKVEGFKDVEISLKRDHDHDVEAAGEGDLGQGEDVRSYTRLDLQSVVRGGRRSIYIFTILLMQVAAKTLGQICNGFFSKVAPL